MLISSVNGTYGILEDVSPSVVTALQTRPLHSKTRALLAWSIALFAVLVMLGVSELADRLFNLSATFRLRDLAVYIPASIVMINLIGAYAVLVTFDHRREEKRQLARSYRMRGVFPSGSIEMQALRLNHFTLQDLHIEEDEFRQYLADCSETTPRSFIESPEYREQAYVHTRAVCHLADILLKKHGHSTQHLTGLEHAEREVLRIARRHMQDRLSTIQEQIQRIDNALS